ncbi:MAG: hypothetical protein WC011_02540 [Candidatus Paceibacterota bacterium]
MEKKIKFDTIRKEWNKNEGKWYFSIVDIVAIVTSSSNPRNYWKVYKNRLKKRQNQLVTECNQLKFIASDGKFYLTDVANVDTITSILKLLDPKNTLTFKAWALSLSKPKEENKFPALKKQMNAEIYIKEKDKSYPQVKYNLLNLIKKSKPE